MEQEKHHPIRSIPHPQIQTSKNNPTRAEKIRLSSEKFIEKNYHLYKSLENK